MRIEKKLFKRLNLFFFFFITFFCIKFNCFAASFPYDKFDWDSFLKQHRDYWVSYCSDGSEECIDEVLVTKKKFYTRLYELLSEYDKKGYFIDDNIIIQTVFYGLTPDSFADSGTIKEEYVGQEIESGYNIDEGSDKDKHIASIDGNIEDVQEYFDRETDSLKTLMNNMVGYYRECYGYVGLPISDESGSQCPEANSVNIDGECWNKVKTIKTNYFDAIGLSLFYSDSKIENECLSVTGDYVSYKLGDATPEMEVNEEIYWDFLINNVYFDKKFQLQDYFHSVLDITGHNSMSELSKDEYIQYEDLIKEARTRIVNNIKDILGSYGNFADTPSSGWTIMGANGVIPSYSSLNSYWWPIGGSDITTDGNIQMAVGEPTSVRINSKYGARTYPYEGMHYGVDIGGEVGVTNVIAIKSGIVIYSTKSENISCEDISDINSRCGSGYGNHVVIQHNDGTYTLYAHMSQGSIIVEKGESVLQGQVLGKVGSSGSSSGGHLHLEIRVGSNVKTSAVDPLLYISPTEPRAVAAEYIVDENGNYISDGTLGNVKIYIHSWEGTPKSSGDNYVVFDDGYGNLTIGWGVHLASHLDKFSALGVDASKLNLGDTLPKYLVDMVEEQILENFANSVKSTLSNNGLVLEYYQVDALISRVYNCGTGGLTGFADAYKTYGVSDALYDNFMYKPNMSSGRVSQGLIRRRMGEWLLFSKGQYEITV